MRLLILTSFLILVYSASSYAQSKEEKSSSNPNSFSPYSSKEEKTQVRQIKKRQKKKSFRNSFNKDMDQKIKEFDKRMQANAKMARKKEREMQKPQYSDPSYFGHKRKPKKRPVGKRKFCKECSIVH
ncbi:hypothetical protein FNH22_04435 [Fulvivirga sp. M361]|uniref:hypothetical protein n=1 Tax=Fulvivirga sp. M361 TaxID=2594266 RepID=UPI00117BC707|nr:hypothetical protein [Fulvivirga sp. M361]TRX61308.1 hypothetical protein FNH22_04435 [Fulvivirga sp. M361]